MAKNKGIYVKVEEPFLAHLTRYFAENKSPGGMSEAVRRYLARKTKYQKQTA